jgi:hypothetical protein
MSHGFRHILIPASMSAIFFAVAWTPVEVFGCATRGLLAASVSLVSALAALGTATIALRGRMRGDPNAASWLISTLILTIPAIALLLMA